MEGEYYLNTRTGEVEKGKRSGWRDRMGPYASAEEAARAFEIARERNAASDTAEKRWREEWDEKDDFWPDD
ncbi:MAG: hypothetical protein QM705_03835 [Ancrocorticia sp.]